MWSFKPLTLGIVCAYGALAFGVTACGSTSTTVSTTVAGTPGVVTIIVTSPTNGSVINADSVTVRGTVTPLNAVVMVQGRTAAVGNGIFSADATLHAGKTTIDVIGSAPGTAPGATSITITRQSAAAAPPHATTPSGSGGGGGATPGVAYAPAGSGSNQTACGGGLSVGPNTSCAFAQNVQSAYRTNGGPGTVTVYSPVTNQTYSMTCNNQSGGVVCTGGNNAAVYFP